MSGIVGIYNLDKRPVEPGILTRMTDVIAHRGADGEGQWTQGPVGLACQLLRVTPESLNESQPLVHSSGTVIVFDGRLDNREEILRSVGKSSTVAADSPDPALVLAAYEAFGDRFAEHLNGDFALGLFDPKEQRLILVRDSIGIRPLYYCRSGKTFLFASEIKAILALPQVSTRPNDDMLAAFLIGVRAQDCHGMTFFEGVSSLRPAHVAIVTRDGFQTKQYWDFDPKRKIRFSSFSEYAEGFHHHFEEAVRRRLRSAYPVAVSVSGGLDSSSIYCLAESVRRHDPQSYAPLRGISYISADGSPSDEKAFLWEIERQYDTAIERIPMGAPGLMDGCREEIWHVEAPFLDSQWNVMDTFLSVAQQSKARVILTGHWGDQMLFDQAYLIDLFHRLAFWKVWAHLKAYGHWCTDVNPRYFRRQFLSDLLRQHVPDAMMPFVRKLKAKLVRGAEDLPWYTERFRKRARQWTSKKTVVGRPTAHFRSLYQEARSRYHVLCMEWNNQVASMRGLEMAFPFLDRDLISFLMGIPGDMHTWNGIHKAVLREAMQGIVPAPILERRSKADFTDVVNEGMERDFPQLTDSLKSGAMVVRLGYAKEDVTREELVRLKNRIRRPDCTNTWSLADLLGLELWLRVFFGKNDRVKEDFSWKHEMITPVAAATR
ncbi:MAG: hypothetical protein DMG36_15615 [Acidobacteria bacterium]|nr:MAG: hypothetical protein DMG36_15615 [Acidobacteriota bacterium]